MKISAGSISSDGSYEVSLEPEEYETFQKASLVALDIPWDLGSARIRDLEILGFQIITSRGNWKAVIRRADSSE